MKQPRRASHEVETIAGGVRVSVAGEVDLAVADDLQAWISDAAESAAGEIVEVDLHAVSFLDSTGIRALVLAQRAVLESGAIMRVTRPRGRVEMVLKLTGVFDLLTTPPKG